MNSTIDTKAEITSVENLDLNTTFQIIKQSLPKNLENYDFSVETIYNVYKLSSSKEVVLYTSGNKEKIEKIAKEKSFIFYTEPTSTTVLRVVITNKNGEKVKVDLGYFQFVKGELMIGLRNSSYKSINKFLRKHFGVIKKGKPSFYLPIKENLYKTYEYQQYPAPVKKDVYLVEYTNGIKREYDKENSFYSFEYVIKNTVEIKSVSSKTHYIFQEPKTLKLIF